jgi:hypothetical protein
MFGPKRSYQLYAGLLAAIVALADNSATISAQESSSAPAAVATLELHDIRASNLKRVADLVTSIVPTERVVLISANRQLAVFAVPSVQDAGAKQMDRADSKAHSPDDSGCRQKPPSFPPADDLETAVPQLQSVTGLPYSKTKFLPVPRGPVKIVHVKGLDLLLIRGRLGAGAEAEPNHPGQDCAVAARSCAGKST